MLQNNIWQQLNSNWKLYCCHRSSILLYLETTKNRNQKRIKFFEQKRFCLSIITKKKLTANTNDEPYLTTRWAFVIILFALLKPDNYLSFKWVVALTVHFSCLDKQKHFWYSSQSVTRGCETQVVNDSSGIVMMVFKPKV